MIAHVWQPGDASILAQMVTFGIPIAVLAAVAKWRGWLDGA